MVIDGLLGKWSIELTL